MAFDRQYARHRNHEYGTFFDNSEIPDYWGVGNLRQPHPELVEGTPGSEASSAFAALGSVLNSATTKV